MEENVRVSLFINPEEAVRTYTDEKFLHWVETILSGFEEALGASNVPPANRKNLYTRACYYVSSYQKLGLEYIQHPSDDPATEHMNEATLSGIKNLGRFMRIALPRLRTIRK